MVQTETSVDQPIRRMSSVAILTAIVVILCLAFLLMPSSRVARTERAKQKLIKEFPGPKDLSYVYGGHLVTTKNQVVSLDQTKESQILIFAPQPKEAISPTVFNQLEIDFSPTGNKQQKAVCLLAPDASMTGWSLFAKVWIGMSLLEKGSAPVTQNAPLLLKSPTAPIKVLAGYWSSFSPEIQREAEAKLAANRLIVEKVKGIHRYFQDGHGKNYEIDISQNIWNFMQTFDEGHPRSAPPVVR